MTNTFRRHIAGGALCLSLAAISAAPGQLAAAPATGAISVRVKLSGTPPGNSVIRMGVDPMCGKITAGQRVVDAVVVADADGNLANAFVSLQGTFPAAAAPAKPVIIDQQGCQYLPRVVGVRVGQTLEVRNSDPLLHNVHAVSSTSNGFNVSVPKAGMVHRVQLKNAESMLHLRCDVHRWMTSFVSVMAHDFFAVTPKEGVVRLAQVPAGTHTIQVWHERFGTLTQTVKVSAGRDSAVSFTYAGTEKPVKIPELSLRD
jgi:plastocyanin